MSLSKLIRETFPYVPIQNKYSKKEMEEYLIMILNKSNYNDEH